MKKILCATLKIKGFGIRLTSSTGFIFPMKLVHGAIFLFIMNLLPITGWAQAAASWNYGTQTGTLGTTYSWIDCSGGTDIVTGDDTQASVSWPFNFIFYNNSYTTANSLSVATNGFIRLDGIANGADYNAASSYNLRSTATNFGQIIATSIYDCYVGRTASSWVKYLVTGTSPNRILTIEYNNIEIDYNDGLYANVQVSFYETLNKVVLKLGSDNIAVADVDMGIHSGVNNFFNKWQEVLGGTNDTWIEYTPPIEVTATIGTPKFNYGTLKTAFDKINDGTHQGAITIKVNISTTETATAALNASGSGSANYTSVNIYPTSTGISISGNLNAPLINFNGADNVTLDGRVNATGTTNDLVISNTRSSTSASTIRFILSAENNSVKYCNIEGSATSTGLGVIVFAGSTAGNGNNNNLIDNNNITSSASGRVYNAIYSAGTAGRENSGVIISNNNFFDFISPNLSSRGISIGSNSVNWTVFGNSFYETTEIAPSGAYNYNMIYCAASTTGHLISGNYIGGSAPQCGGAAFTVNSNTTHSFYAMNIVGGTVSPVTVQDNTIKNFNYTSINTNPWDGIYLASNKIDVIGNSIGATTGTGSIVVTTPGTSSYSTTHAIRSVSTGVVTISNNSIGSITTIGSNTYSHCFEGIVISGAAPSISITNNLIGSLTTANSIQTTSTAVSSSFKQDLRGIYINSAVTLSTITGNTIANLTNAYTGGSFSKFDGICTSGGSNIIQNNTIRDFTTGSSSIILKGIQQTVVSAGTNHTVTGNTIYNLSNTHASALIVVMGIDFSCPTSGVNVVSENFIHSLNISSTNVLSEIDGIRLSGGLVTCANNIVNIGLSLSLGYKLYGIFENSGVSIANVNNIYFNSIYLGGTVSSGTTSSTAALWSSNNTNIRNIRNNIFVNARSGGATGLHYAIRAGGTSGLTIDFNDYYAPNGVLGSLSGDRATLAAWQSATGQDASSLNIDPIFNNAGGTVATDYYTSAALPGISGTGITTDYAGITRGSTPLMGALEINNYIWKGSISTDFATAGNWIGGVVPPNGADIYFDTNPDRSCVLDQDRSMKNIINAQGTDLLVLNGKVLTVTGDLIFSTSAKIDGTAEFSSIIFAGAEAQSIPLGSFVSNTIDTLTINNVNGLALNGDFTINKAIALIAGNFAIGANTLTFNGVVTAMTGTVTGGSSTNMIIGGTGAVINMPSFTLNNLTINRASGVSLYGNVELVGILTLTNGTLTIGTNTLTISGSSPLRTSGNIDASNASATIVFNNSSALTLPSSIFTGAINNFTLSGSGGVTASSDFSINGILNLQSANPSATKGILDIWDGSEAKTLTMGANATTIGEGDITGIVARSYFTSGVQYTFGSQHTNISFIPGGTFPDLIKVKIEIGTAPTWKPDAINRLYDFVQSGGLNCFATISSRYLESELNGNDENYLSQWTFGANGQQPAGAYDWGFTNYDIIENWVAIADVNIAYFPTTFGDLENTLATSVAEYVVWNGSASIDWETPANWTPNTVPNTLSYVVIPDAETTPNDPLLPAIAEINNIWLQLGSVLNSNTNSILTLTGNVTWINGGGTFVPSTGTVVLSNTTSNVSGKTSFYNLTIPATTTTWLSLASYIKIAGTLTNNGILRTVIAGETTVEYNGLGDQTVVVPNSSTNRYSNLILSGSGTKTLPASSLDIVGNFSVLESAITVAAESLSISDNFIIDHGASFTTGNFNHSIGGNFDCNGALIASVGNTITFNGSNEQSVYGNTLTLESLTINNSAGVYLYAELTVNNTLTLTSGTLSVGESTLSINSSLVKTSGFLSVTELSSLYFGGIDALTVPPSLFTSTPSVNNLTINRIGGITFGCDLTVNGILNLQSGNPSLTLGSLNMDSYTLDMGGSATTIGIGDVTGIVKRTSFAPNIAYSFGNPSTTVTFPNTGTLPSAWSIKISIGAAPNWKSDAINRTYELIRTGGSGSLPTVKLQYSDVELNSNAEAELVFYGYQSSDLSVTEYGRINSDVSDNWVSLSGPIEFAPTSFGEREWTLANRTTGTYYIWNGTVVGSETDWTANMNWSSGAVPTSTSDVIIPAGCDNYPTLPTTTSINSISIELGAIVNGGISTSLTINGALSAWNNRGTLSPGTSTIIFTNSAASMSGATSFFNLTIDAGANVSLTTGNTIQIAGVLSNHGSLDATQYPNTVEYNGDAQTVINPNGATTGYYNLILSGSGAKSLPGTAMNIFGDITINGTVTATAAEAITVAGGMNVGSDAAFATGSYNHSIGGNLENNGIFTASAGETITMNGTSAQIILGSSTIDFESLTIDNPSGISLSTDISVSDVLTLTSGNLSVGTTTLTINGGLTADAGFIYATSFSSLNFGGTTALTVPNDIFIEPLSIDNLTIDRSGGVIWGEQDVTVEGLLNLSLGSLTLGSNTLTIEGDSPERTTGEIDASNTAATIEFTNAAAIVLPSSFFSGNVNNMIINSIGGVSSNGDIFLNGILNLQSANPSATKGALDMSSNTFNMGELSHVIGIGDVTGIVKREHTFNSNQEYCFGNENTRITFLGVPSSTKPTWVSCKIEIGTAPIWRGEAVKRFYSFAQQDGTDRAWLKLHYLDSELNPSETDESRLTFWNDYDGLATGDNTFVNGKTSYDATSNWVGLVGMAIDFIAPSTSFAKQYGLGYTNVAKITWTGLGSASYSGDWSLPGHWSGGVPSATDDVLIPTGLSTTYPYRNLLPSTSPAVAKTIEIESGASLSVDSYDLTIYGATDAWINNGTFTPGTGTVYFANGSTSNIATISGTTNFYNLRVEPNTYIQPAAGSIIRVESEILFDATSILDFASNANTVEFNGADQTIINPGGLYGYHNLNFSGDGKKILPESSLLILGNLSIDAAISATGNTILMAGTSAQNLGGTIAAILNNLTIDNVSGVTLTNDVTLAAIGTLSVEDGATLTLTAGPVLTFDSGSAVTTGTGARIILEPDAAYLNLGGSTPVLEVQRDFHESGGKGWRMVASPVAATYGDMFASPMVTQGFAGSMYEDLQPNLLWWDETDKGTTLQGWRLPAGATPMGEIISAGAGHYYYIFHGAGRLNPDGSSSGASYPDLLPQTMTVTGVEPNIYAGSFTFIPLTFTPRTLPTEPSGPGDTIFNESNPADEGWNMLGNPTASTLDWHAATGWTRNNIDNTIYIWDPSVNEFKYTNGEVGNFGGLIAPFQAFWVRANALSPELSFTNDAKSPATGTFLKKASSASPMSVRLSLSGGQMETTSFISFGGNGIIGPDPWDAYRLEPPANTWLELFTLSSPTHASPLVVNNLPSLQQEEMINIPLFVGGQVDGEVMDGRYTLKWQLPDMWPAGYRISLHDHRSQKVIAMAENEQYTFSYKPSVLKSTGREDFALPGKILKPVSPGSQLKSSNQLKNTSQLPPFSIIISNCSNCEEDEYISLEPMLLPNYPNPFSHSTTIRFSLPGAAHVRIDIYDFRGMLVASPANAVFPAGFTEINWQPVNRSSDMYLIRFISGGISETRKAVFLDY